MSGPRPVLSIGKQCSLSTVSMGLTGVPRRSSVSSHPSPPEKSPSVGCYYCTCKETSWFPYRVYHLVISFLHVSYSNSVFHLGHI